MAEWKWVADSAVLFGCFAILGAAFDRLMLKRHKITLYDAIERWWISIAEIRIPFFHQLMAERTLHIGTFLFGTKAFSPRAFLLFSCISISLTFIFSVSGFWMGSGQYVSENLSVLSVFRLWFAIVTSEVNTVILFLIALPLLNMLYDGLTLFVTRHFLRIIRSSSVLRATLAIAADGLLASVLAISCFWVAIGIASNLAINFNFEDPTIFSIGSTELELWMRKVPYANTVSIFLFSLTSLFPTLLYFIILASLLISKVVISSAKWITEYYLELAVDQPVEKFAPFTLVGAYCGILASVARTLLHFLSK